MTTTFGTRTHYEDVPEEFREEYKQASETLAASLEVIKRLTGAELLFVAGAFDLFVSGAAFGYASPKSVKNLCVALRAAADKFENGLDDDSGEHVTH